ncbi:MAG TPA: hypothetical protein VGN86_15475 [Pyrinomonadaceae bacterium]|jgi:hypothetical protein|nr:hypothetical protein [Pyrinomonadaceae bacterium]
MKKVFIPFNRRVARRHFKVARAQSEQLQAAQCWELAPVVLSVARKAESLERWQAQALHTFVRGRQTRQRY